MISNILDVAVYPRPFESMDIDWPIVIIAVAVAICAIVTIILINKKKKK